MNYPDLQIVDEHDEPIGQGQYTDIRRAGKYHRAVGVLVINSQREVLLQRRGKHVNEAGRWDISAGGHIDAGETYEEGAAREAREEIGLVGVKLERLGKHLSDFAEGDAHVRRFATIFLARWDGDIIMDRHEVTEVKWVPLAELGEWVDRAPQELARELVIAYHKYLAPMVV